MQILNPNRKAPKEVGVVLLGLVEILQVQDLKEAFQIEEESRLIIYDQLLVLSRAYPLQALDQCQE